MKSIESSSVGFFINYEVSRFGKHKCDFKIGDVYGDVDNIEFAMGFLLYIKMVSL